MARPKKTSTRGIVLEIEGDREITEKFVWKEANELFTNLHSDSAVIFPEVLLENKFYTYEDFVSWVVKYSEINPKIRKIGKKIQELLRGRIKKAVTSDRVNPAFIKFLLSTEFGYNEKTVTEVQHKVDTELSAEKRELLDLLRGDKKSNEDGRDVKYLS
jgi:hypothetical protein